MHCLAVRPTDTRGDRKGTADRKRARNTVRRPGCTAFVCMGIAALHKAEEAHGIYAVGCFPIEYALAFAAKTYSASARGLVTASS